MISSSLAYDRVKLGASDRWIGTWTGAAVISTLLYSFVGRSAWLHGYRRQHSPQIDGLRPRKLYHIRSVAVTAAPVRVPTQRPLIPSFA